MCDVKANSHHGSGAVLMQQWFRSLGKGFALVLVGMCCYTSAYAATTNANNNCNNANDGVAQNDAYASTNCDTNYRDEALTCEGERAVWGACPPKAIPHKRTKALSFKDLSPYLWYSVPHPTAQLRKYDGPLYRGSKGDSRLVNSMVRGGAANLPSNGRDEQDPKGTKQTFASCVHQIELRNGASSSLSLKERAAIVRLQLDNCANQYILNAAMEPTRKENSPLLVSKDRCQPPERLNAKIACQPLHIELSGLKNEYSVTPYLESAWGRMLQHVQESDVSSEDSVREGVVKYKGYMRRKRGFGPFDGILGSIFNLINTFSALMDTISNLGNMAQFNMQMPNFQQAMRAFQNGFSQMGNQFANFPGQITSGFTNMQNTFARFGANFQNMPANFMSNTFGGFTQGFTNMQQGLQGLGNLPDSVMGGLGDLGNLNAALPNFANMMQNLPQNLGNLQSMIPNISNLPGQAENIGNIMGNLSGDFRPTMNAIGQLPGQVGGAFRSGIQGGMANMSGIPNIVGNMANNTNIVLGFNGADPATQIGNQLDQQSRQLNSINNRLSRGGNMSQVGGNLRDAGRVVSDIPNIDLATGGVVTMSANIGNMNALSNVLNGNSMMQSFNNMPALDTVNQYLGSMRDLESGLNQMRNQMASGQRFGNLTMPQLDSYISNVASYNNFMRGIDTGQLSQIMRGMNQIQRTFNNGSFGNIGNLGNFNSFMSSMSRNLQGMTNMGAFGNILGSMQSNVMGALDFGIDVNFRSAASRMKARKDSEVHPRVSKSVIIRNPLPAPTNVPDIKLTQLAAFPYEEITDPSHPFSPRWHYYVNDRDGYSPWATKYTKENDGNKKYQENSVFCAGERLEDETTKKKEVIKVDVLEYRRKKFDLGENQMYDGIFNRMFFNQYCFNNEGAQEDPCYIKVKVLYVEVEKDLPCFACFGLKTKSSGKGKRTNTPPCATSHSGKDRRIIMSPINGAIGDVIAIITSIPPISQFFEFKVLAGDYYMQPGIPDSGTPIPSVGLYAGALAGGGIPDPLCLIAKLGCPAACSLPNIYRKSSIKKLCRDLRAPYVPMNKLKMRYGLREKDVEEIQAEEQEAGQNQNQQKLKNELPGGVGDGMMHKDHFDNRMPYPRVWDAGRSIQLTPSTQQDPRDQNGKYTSIVGIGREAVPQPDPNQNQQGGASQQPVKARGVDCGENPEACKEERCMIGGWGDDITVAGTEIKQHDPVSSWTELKLYQARTLRDFGINCIGRYERLFKPGAQEDHVLTIAGGTYMERSDSCGLEDGTAQENTNKFKVLQRNFPKAWRGIAGDPGNDGKDAFPKFPTGSASDISRGLDNAKQGDVLIFPNGNAGGSRKGLPLLSYVDVVNNSDGCEDKSGCFVTVLERNFSKWPDACGNTDSWGIESNRRLYKKGTMPSSLRSRIRELDNLDNVSCEDTDLQNCELSDELWDGTEVYHIRKEMRGGNAGSTTTP